MDCSNSALVIKVHYHSSQVSIHHLYTIKKIPVFSQLFAITHISTTKHTMASLVIVVMLSGWWVLGCHYTIQLFWSDWTQNNQFQWVHLYLWQNSYWYKLNAWVLIQFDVIYNNVQFQLWIQRGLNLKIIMLVGLMSYFDRLLAASSYLN